MNLFLTAQKYKTYCLNNGECLLTTNAELDLRRNFTAVKRSRSALITVIRSCTDPKIKSFKS